MRERLFSALFLLTLASLGQVLSKSEAYCLNNKDPSGLTVEQNLEEFIKGPCAPVVVIPGIMGSALTLTIDCPAFKEKQPTIFKNCGWDSCEKGLFNHVPEKQYRIWVSDIHSPVTIFEIFQSQTCFGDLISLNFNQATQEFEDITFQTHGYEVRCTTGRCGSSAVEYISSSDVLNDFMIYLQGFSGLLKRLNQLGYLDGLTLQSIPYDYRYSIIHSTTSDSLQKSIDNLFLSTGKKVVLLGHSLGTIHTLYALTYKISQEEKDLKVAQFVLAAPPLLGSVKSFKPHLGGDDEFIDNIVKNFDIGINYYGQQEFGRSFHSLFDLYPKDTFFRFKDEPWMSEIKKRMEFENNFNKGQTDTPSEPPFAFLPTPDKICTPLRKSSPNCTLNLFDDSLDSGLEIEQNKYFSNFESLNQMLDRYSISKGELQQLYSQIQKDQYLYDLLNPNVSMVFVFGNSFPVEKKLIYQKDVKNATQSTQFFYFPEKTELSTGDGTVTSTSALVPALKWIYEYQQNIPGAKPVKLVEYGSIFNQKTTVYDEDLKDVQGRKFFTQVTYQGLKSVCTNPKKNAQCLHSTLINDPNFIDFITDVLATEEVSQYANKDYSAIVKELNPKQLIEICPNIQQEYSNLKFTNYRLESQQQKLITQ